MGLGFNQRIRFGIGYSILASNSVTKKIHISENNLEYDTDGNLHLGYVSLSAEYFFYNDYPWQFTFTPFNIGIGSARYQYVNRPDRLKAFTDTKTIILYQPEISAQYSILRWLGVGITTGYRLSVLKTPAETKLNSFTYALDLRLYLDEIYKMIFDKEEEK